ncbi:MAG TPA: GNAT family N-acetyltransferase [Anaerolineales bacterium]|nr:GNAT family N-acetyltransferase [Anaerolineales bacterium]
MINLHLHIRRAVAQDHRQLSNLLFQESNTHRHLDWRTALEWIGVHNFWVLEDSGTVVAALACPEDPPDIAWIRLFSFSPHLSGPEAWSDLWNFASAEIRAINPRAEAASIVMKQWFQTLLLDSGFEPRLSIVLLELKSEDYVPVRISDAIRMRPMQEADLGIVEDVDREAFGKFWHNTSDALQRAHGQSFYSSVAEDANGIIGYQISTGNPFGVHLARLGVRPEAQGKGVGSALVHDLIQRAGGLQSGRLSVNTQDDNAASLRLYSKLGFLRTGEHYPVFIHSLGAS